MKKKRRLFLLILILIFIIIQIIAFTNSRAEKIINMDVQIADADNILKTENIKLIARNKDNTQYSIILPEYINDKKILKYEIKQQIENDENNIKEDTNETKEENLINNTINENIINNNTVNIIQENTINTINTINTVNTNIVNNIVKINNTSPKQEENVEIKTIEKKPGDEVILSEQEVEAKTINLKVFYDDKEVNGVRLYNKLLEKQEDRKIIIEGYMPEDARTRSEKNRQSTDTGGIRKFYNKYI